MLEVSYFGAAAFLAPGSAIAIVRDPVLSAFSGPSKPPISSRRTLSRPPRAGVCVPNDGGERSTFGSTTAGPRFARQGRQDAKAKLAVHSDRADPDAGGGRVFSRNEGLRAAIAKSGRNDEDGWSGPRASPRRSASFSWRSAWTWKINRLNQLPLPPSARPTKSVCADLTICLPNKMAGFIWPRILDPSFQTSRGLESLYFPGLFGGSGGFRACAQALECRSPNSSF